MKIIRIAAAVICSLSISCNAAMAGSVYNIDPTQSWVSAYVSTWVPGISSPEFHPEPNGQLIPIEPAPQAWQLSWNLATFVLSGSFEGMTEWSPWVPGVGHFTMSQKHFIAGIPNPETFNPISQFTFGQPHGDVYFSPGPCAHDPFFPPQPGLHCSGWVAGGILPSLAGVFDGTTLDIQGSTGGEYPVFNNTSYVGLTPPSLVDPSLFPPSQSYGYKIVAYAVPEPGTIFLIFVGIAVAYHARNRGGFRRKV